MARVTPYQEKIYCNLNTSFKLIKNQCQNAHASQSNVSKVLSTHQKLSQLFSVTWYKIKKNIWKTSDCCGHSEI
jgi:hypothetical protein